MIHMFRSYHVEISKDITELTKIDKQLCCKKGKPIFKRVLKDFYGWLYV